MFKLFNKDIDHKIIEYRNSEILSGSFYITNTTKIGSGYVTYISCVRDNGYDDTIASIHGFTESQSSELAEKILKALNKHL